MGGEAHVLAEHSRERVREWSEGVEWWEIVARLAQGAEGGRGWTGFGLVPPIENNTTRRSTTLQKGTKYDHHDANIFLGRKGCSWQGPHRFRA